MPQYFLAVNHDEAGRRDGGHDAEDMQPMFDPSARSTTSSGPRGPGCSPAGCRPLEHHRGRRHRRHAGHHRRPVRGVQGVPRRLLDHRGRRPRRRPRSGPPRARGPARAGSRSGPSRRRLTPPAALGGDAGRRSSGSSARSTAGWSPRWRAASATSTSPRTPPARRCWSPLEKWPVDGVPPNPGGWLTTTAGNRAIDRIRREQHRDAKHQAALMISDDTPHEPTGAVEDDRLRLVFTCCHPALAPEARVALTLRLLGGLTVAEIAQAFLVPETTMAQRITRAKTKITRRRHPLPGARGGRPARAAGRRPGRGLPGLQRGLPLDRRGDAGPRRAHRRGDPARPDPAPAAARRARGHRAARADAAHRGPPPGPDRRRRRRWCRCTSRTAAAGTATWSPRATPWCASACAPQPARALPAAGRDRRRAHRRPDAPPTPTGRRSPPSTASSPALDPEPGGRAQPRGRRRRARRAGGRAAPWSTGSPSPRAATTPSTPPAPTCCAGSAAAPRRARPTTPRSRSSTTRPRRAYLTRRRDQLGCRQGGRA